MREGVFGFDTLVFTPDSRFLVSRGEDVAEVTSVEDASAGELLDVAAMVDVETMDVEPLGADAAVYVGASDNGCSIVTFTESTGARMWSVEPERLLDHVCTVAGRNLTQEEWEDLLPDRPYQHLPWVPKRKLSRRI